MRGGCARLSVRHRVPRPVAATQPQFAALCDLEANRPGRTGIDSVTSGQYSSVSVQ